ncbi:ATP-binding protein [Streptomyces durbertensis]|uniref:ATP-binding protein n=1 Tax=Streptomyces durbertensis TaxID=2448886 RepID=A0ABR6EH33_9ACTN|nr:ATP-binding protein [Streptomyces durbertensis]MBB1244627.1 ATP-binding protein [Streptomyces durbertensis]
MARAALADPPPGAPPPGPGACYRLTAPSLRTTPKIAREWVAVLLGVAGLARLADRAMLCTSELVTNAHRHGRSVLITVEVALLPDAVTVQVRDDNPQGLPSVVTAVRDCDPWEEGGRGLHLVDCLADSWDHARTGPGTKVVWFTLRDRR